MKIFVWNFYKKKISKFFSRSADSSPPSLCWEILASRWENYFGRWEIILAWQVGKLFWQVGKLFWKVHKLFWQVGKLFCEVQKIILVREAPHLQNGWIFGKVPNSHCKFCMKNAEKCREMNRNVEKCRKCRKIQRNADMQRYTHDLFDLHDTR